ncbi:hypothetical protein Tco_0041827 [Tanacetum coccineum]
MLRATEVQILEDDLDNLHSLREVDGTLVVVDPQDLVVFITAVLLTDSIFLFFLGFLEYTKLTTGLGDLDSRTIGFHRRILSFLVLPEGCDPLALEESLTLVECNTCLFETMFEVESVFVFSVDVSDSANLTFLSFFLGVTATN